MTVLRLGVIIFLLLVAAGYGLLTIKVLREKSLPWLIGGCILATFITFYLVQFLNLAGWSADYNVTQWEKDKSRSLDVAYLRGLGPSAWPALRRAADDGAAWDNYLLIRDIIDQDEIIEPRANFDFQHWREFSLRAYWNSGALEDKK